MADMDSLLRAGFYLGTLEENLKKLHSEVLLGSDYCTILGKMHDLQEQLEEKIEDDLK